MISGNYGWYESEMKVRQKMESEQGVQGLGEQNADLRRQLDEAQALAARALEGLRLSWGRVGNERAFEISNKVNAILSSPGVEANAKWLEEQRAEARGEGYRQAEED